MGLSQTQVLERLIPQEEIKDLTVLPIHKAKLGEEKLYTEKEDWSWFWLALRVLMYL